MALALALQSGDGPGGRVDRTETRRVNVRLIAATHRDLEGTVEGGTFREDFYYRLRRAVVEVPPLRARREDVAHLVEHLVATLNERYGFSVRGVTREALRLLVQHAWRGNVRELEAVLEQAMIFRAGEWITPEDLDLPASRRNDAGETDGGAGRDETLNDGVALAAARGTPARGGTA